jgi:hypothetical protein
LECEGLAYGFHDLQIRISAITTPGLLPFAGSTSQARKTS